MLTGGGTECFLPPERVPVEVVREQRDVLMGIPLLTVFLNGMPDGAAILNDRRQIVVANASLLHALGDVEEESLIGRRPGEAFRCVHYKGPDDECGSTGFCRYCGAAKVLLQSRMGKKAADECRIVLHSSSMAECEIRAMDLLVWGTPFSVGGESFTFFAFCDISHEKRRAVLERLFFHDFLNMAGNVRALMELLLERQRPSADDLVRTAYRVADIMVHEIRSQRVLLEAEKNELAVEPRSIFSLAFIEQTVRYHQPIYAPEKMTIHIDPESERFLMLTDDTLLTRVIDNLIKNAMEASEPGETVKVGCFRDGDRGAFWVWNRAFVPLDTQRQFFKRSFSTKDRSRGLGLYSVRLFTENYLGGKVSFHSTPEDGTTFRISLPLNPQARERPGATP